MAESMPLPVPESAYAVPADAATPEKMAALRTRMEQLLAAYQSQFEPLTQTVTEWTEDGTTKHVELLPLPEMRFTELPGVYAKYDPSSRKITTDLKDVRNPDDWDHLFNETMAHELGHYTAHARNGEPQGHSENWEGEQRMIREAYGRAMVRAAEQQEAQQMALADLAGIKED